jgi:hypothetical protein
MRIIIDECVPSIVKRALPDRDISTVQQMGWAGAKNGKLLSLVASDFDVFITSDQNLRYQQNLSSFGIAVIVLPSNQVPIVKQLVPAIEQALESLRPGDLVEVSLPR